MLLSLVGLGIVLFGYILVVSLGLCCALFVCSALLLLFIFSFVFSILGLNAVRFFRFVTFQIRSW